MKIAEHSIRDTPNEAGDPHELWIAGNYEQQSHSTYAVFDVVVDNKVQVDFCKSIVFG